MNEEELSVFRSEQIGFVFQNYNLLPILSVYENILLPQKLQGKEIDVKFVEEIVAAFGIGDDKIHQRRNTKIYHS